MKGFRGLSLALVLTGMLLPGDLTAQRETREVKEAQKHLGLAMLRSEGPERTKMYQDALTALQPALTNDAQNALVWLLAGQAHAGLGNLTEADQAFDKAVELHAEYAEEISAERESGWVVGFQRAVAQMEAGQNEDAIATFTAANELYPERPEGYLNLASLYAQTDNTQKAIEALETAAEKAHGPLYEKLDSADQASWTDLRRIAISNLGQLQGAAGVEAFQAEDYQAAQTWFEQALETNPHSRDYLFNIIQAKWAQARKLEDQVEETPTTLAELQPRLTTLYEDMKTQIPRVQTIDPNNETMIMMAAQMEKRLHELRGDSANASQAAYAILQKLETMPVTLDDIIVETMAENTQAQVRGNVKNVNLEGGAPVTINVTLIGNDGQQVGSGQIQVNAPVKEESAAFEGTIPVTGPVAGWRYTVGG
jgi:tetratricopeptide (TPR) repeat protein